MQPTPSIAPYKGHAFPVGINVGNHYDREQKAEIMEAFKPDYDRWMTEAEALGMSKADADALVGYCTKLHALDVAGCNRQMTDLDKRQQAVLERCVRRIMEQLGPAEWSFTYEPAAPPVVFWMTKGGNDHSPAYINL